MKKSGYNDFNKDKKSHGQTLTRGPTLIMPRSKIMQTSCNTALLN